MEAYFDKENKLEDYLGEKKLYCREERQFAALLYSVFLEKMRTGETEERMETIVRTCLSIEDVEHKKEKYKIMDVYFEATLMRDFFERKEKDKEKENKIEFNQRLLKFCSGGGDKLEKWLNQLKTEKDIPYNLGQKEAKQQITKKITTENQNISERLREYICDVICGTKSVDDQNLIQKVEEKTRLDIAGMMMNATPDILVVYEMGEKKYAKALECKYESDEGIYEDVAGVKRKMQFFIQECIMLFLFGKREPAMSENDFRYPQRPTKGEIWGIDKKSKDYEKIIANREAVWEKIFSSVYKDIMKQECTRGGIINAGVEVVQFVSPNDKKDRQNKEEWRKIEIKDLQDIYKKKREERR